jgi:regulator of sirC expression with transglutaminase-like and TPR domain
VLSISRKENNAVEKSTIPIYWGYNIAMNLDTALEQLARDNAAPLDIAEVALFLAKDEYPDIDVEAHLAEVAAMAHEARRFVRGDLSARVAGLCRYLFHEMGFHGNPRDYYDPRNSYLNMVLERRTGIPISLSAVMMAVGCRVGLDVKGVGLPGHFVVKVVEGSEGILVDPYHGGRLLTRIDCDNIARQVTGQEFRFEAADLEAVPLALIVFRMLNNLKGIYLKARDFGRAIRVMERMRQVRPEDLATRRDLGICMVDSGQHGKAIDHLSAYANAAPDADDAEVVRLLLKDARAYIANWN